MRNAFSKALVELALADPKVLLLTGDHGYALFDEFRKTCPLQYINAGIAEQNMVGMAAGLARIGFRPVVYGLSAFIPVRVLEQIKLDVAHDNLPVIFIGDGAGFVYSHLGTSHQSTEDIACTRAIPNMHVYSPADSFETMQCINAAYQSNSPVYLRIGKSDLGSIHRELPIHPIGHLTQLKKGSQGGVSFLATGSLVHRALKIAGTLYPDVSVWSVPFIKPIDIDQVVNICSTSSAIISFEEHSVYGGLGSLIAEIASEYSPVHIMPIGVKDRFSKKCGSYEYLLTEHEINRFSIEKQIRNFLSNLKIN